MKSIRLIALSALLTIGSFCAVTYTSCTKDECKSVTCLNGGTCSGGSCTCKSGIGGNSCETVYRNLYANNYQGTATDNGGFTYTNHRLNVTTGNDTSDYTKMSVQWASATNNGIVTLPVVISNNTASGSVFTVTRTTVDSFTYTGTGTISASAINMTLTEATPNTTAVIISFTNFLKI